MQAAAGVEHGRDEDLRGGEGEGDHGTAKVEAPREGRLPLRRPRMDRLPGGGD